MGMAPSPPLVLTSIAGLFVGLAAWSLYQWHDKQASLPACEMTYNYNGYTQLTSPLLPNHSGYTLHLYREGGIGYGPTGHPNVPVLFVPGNAGRHMQGRSLASECGRQWSRRVAALASTSSLHPDQPPLVNLDWHMVDTREQLSAFHGDVLERQVEYILACLLYLKHKYQYQDQDQDQDQDQRHPSAQLHAGILIVGHSMGGVVARAAAARAAVDPKLGPGLVSLLLTLASPHQRPPLPAHPSLHRFYSALAALPLDDVPLLSLAGGYNDSEVATALTALQGVSPPSLSLHTSSEAIPGVWTSAHHNCIVWCNQLVVKLAALLLDMGRELQLKGWQEEGGGRPSSEQQGGDARVSGSGQQGRNAIVMRLARDALVGRSTRRQLMMPAPGTDSGAGGGGAGPGDAGRAGEPEAGPDLDLGRALQQAARKPCHGANLAWYMQYNTPTVVTKPLLQLKHAHIKLPVQEGLGKTGRLYHWPLNSSLASSATTSADEQHRAQVEAGVSKPAAPADAGLTFALLVSGAKPCSGFRVWVLRNGSSSRDSLLGRDVEVTELMVQLPPLHPAARQTVRNWSDANMVMKGKDYEAASSWLLHLPAHMHQAAGLMVWLGEVSLRKAFHLTAQLTNEPPAHHITWLTTTTTTSSSTSAPYAARLVSEVQLHQPQLALPGLGLRLGLVSWSRLALAITATPAPAPAPAPGTKAPKEQRKPRTCLHPLLAIPRGPGGEEHLASNLTSFNLEACGGGRGGGVAEAGTCSVLLLLDPGCRYALRLVPDWTSLLLETLLQRLSLLWAVAQAVLGLAVCDVWVRGVRGAGTTAAAGGTTAQPCTDSAASSLQPQDAGAGARSPGLPAADNSMQMGEQSANGENGCSGSDSTKPASAVVAAHAGLRGAECRTRHRRAPQSPSTFSAVCAAVLRGWVSSAAYLVLLLLPAALLSSTSGGSAVPVLSPRVKELWGMMAGSNGGDSYRWLMDGGGHRRSAVGVVAAFALMTPIASFVTRSQWLAVEHAVALAAVAAAAVVEDSLRPPAADRPAAGDETATCMPSIEDLLLLLPAAALLILLLHALLTTLAFLLRCCWSTALLLMTACRRRGRLDKTTNQSSVGDGGPSHAHTATLPADAGPSGSSDAPQPAASRLSYWCCGVVAVGTALFVAPCFLLHEQLVAWCCYAMLLLVTSAPGLQRRAQHLSPHHAAQLACVRLWQSLFILGAACALPSWLAWIQLQRDSYDSNISDAGTAVSAGRMAGFGAPPSASVADVLSRGVHLLPAAAACIIAGKRVLTSCTAVKDGGADRWRPALDAMLVVGLGAVAKAGLVCAVLGIDWATYFVQFSLALLACLRTA